MKSERDGIRGLLGAGLALLILLILLGFVVIAFRIRFLGSFESFLYFLALTLIALGVEKRILTGRNRNPPEHVVRGNRLLLYSSGFFMFGFFLFVIGLLQLLRTGQTVMNYGWDSVDTEAYLIIAFGFASGSMLLIAGVVAFKRFLDLSEYL